jgi:hypothetical protein
MWVYLTKVQALHLDLHIGAVRRVHSTFIYEFSTEAHKMQVIVKSWGSTMEIGKIPSGETGDF